MVYLCASMDVVMGTGENWPGGEGGREAAAETVEWDGGEESQREVKEDSRGGAKVWVQRSGL